VSCISKPEGRSGAIATEIATGHRHLVEASDTVCDDLLELLRWPEVSELAVLLGLDLDWHVARYRAIRGQPDSG
jgi:hypothetical protein